MKVIDVDAATAPRATLMVYGESGSGKTQFAATWPRPRFLADYVEGGFETIRTMDRGQWHERDWKPQVRGIESMADFVNELKLIGQDVAKGGPLAPKTGVIDSLSFYATLLEDYFRTTLRDEIEKNKFLLWQKMGTHLHHVLIEAHKIPINWIWICLDKEGEDGNGPLLPGQIAKKLPAACQHYLYMRMAAAIPSAENRPAQPAQRQIRTQKYGKWPARTRAGAKTPDPIEPTYLAFAKAVGLISTTPPRVQQPGVRPTNAAR